MASLILLILIPPFLFGLLDMSSYLPGVLVLSLSHLIICTKYIKLRWVERVVISKPAALFLYLTLVFPIYALESPTDSARYFLSLFCLAFIFSVADLTACAISTRRGHAIYYGMAINALLFAMMIAVTACGYLLPWNSLREKPVFIYPEISHFVLAASPVLIFCFTVVDKVCRILIAFVVAFTLLIYPSLTLAVLLLLCIIVFVRKAWIIVLVAILVGFIVTNLQIGFLEYYKSRIDIGGDNLSMLVFLSGWERAYLSFVDTYGFGLGFQQLGVYGSEGDIYGTIRQLAIGDVNLYDGGSNAAKLVSELGIVGVYIIAIYGFLLKESVTMIRHIFMQPVVIRRSYANEAFVYSSVIAYSLELFVRGQGYFSVGLVFLLIAISMRRQLSIANGAID